MEEDIDDLRSDVGYLSRSVSAMEPIVKSLDAAVYGNGRPGMVVELTKIQAQVKLQTKIMSSLGGLILAIVAGVAIKLFA